MLDINVQCFFKVGMYYFRVLDLLDEVYFYNFVFCTCLAFDRQGSHVRIFSNILIPVWTCFSSKNPHGNFVYLLIWIKEKINFRKTEKNVWEYYDEKLAKDCKKCVVQLYAWCVCVHGGVSVDIIGHKLVNVSFIYHTFWSYSVYYHLLWSGHQRRKIIGLVLVVFVYDTRDFLMKSIHFHFLSCVYGMCITVASKVFCTILSGWQHIVVNDSVI